MNVLIFIMVLTIIFFSFVSVGSIACYFLFSKKEADLKATGKEFRFTPLISAIFINMTFWSLNILGAITLVVLSHFLESLIIKLMIFLVVLGLLLLIINKFLIVPIDEENYQEKATEQEIIKKYKATKLSVCLWGILFVLGFLQAIFMFSDIVSLTGIMFGGLGFIRMIRGLLVFKVMLTNEKLKYDVNIFHSAEIEFEVIDQLKLDKKIIDSNRLEIISYKDNSKEVDRRIKIAETEKIEDLINEIMQYNPQVEIGEGVKSLVKA
ncbi:MAG: hypothetical protein ACQERJ_10310 [Bacillota bacterium]